MFGEKKKRQPFFFVRLARCVHFFFSLSVRSIGGIFAEMVTKEALFPGDSEIDELFKIFRSALLGRCCVAAWLTARRAAFCRRPSTPRGRASPRCRITSRRFPSSEVSRSQKARARARSRPRAAVPLAPLVPGLSAEGVDLLAVDAASAAARVRLV